MKLAIWFLYGVALIVLFSIANRRGDVEATARLSANRLIQDGDVRLGGGPFYVRDTIESGQPVRAANLRPAPWPQPPPGMLAIGLPTHRPGGSPPAPTDPRPWARVPLNAGDRAFICPASADLTAPLPVLAVLCSPDGVRCTAIATATPQQTAAIAQARQAGELFLARSCR